MTNCHRQARQIWLPHKPFSLCWMYYVRYCRRRHFHKIFLSGILFFFCFIFFYIFQSSSSLCVNFLARRCTLRKLVLISRICDVTIIMRFWWFGAYFFIWGKNYRTDRKYFFAGLIYQTRQFINRLYAECMYAGMHIIYIWNYSIVRNID